MCVCICSGYALFSRRDQTQAGAVVVVIACGEVWEADGEWMWSGGWSSRLALALALSPLRSLVPCSRSLCLSLLLLPPSSLLLAETGLDQASNLAHARMDEAKLCRDCIV